MMMCSRQIAMQYSAHCRVQRPMALLLLAIVAAIFMVPAQAQQASEYQVEAAYLYNFGKFTSWDDTPPQITICVLGRNPFDNALVNTVRGEQINGHAVTVKHVFSAAEASKCQIVFVSDSERGNVGTVIGALADRPVLTVSDMPNFVDRGGIVQFVQQDRRIRFVVNLDAAQRAHVRLSSELLRVASGVRGGPK